MMKDFLIQKERAYVVRTKVCSWALLVRTRKDFNLLYYIYILSHFSLAKQVTRNLLKKIVLRPICDLPSYPLRMK